MNKNWETHRKLYDENYLQRQKPPADCETMQEQIAEELIRLFHPNRALDVGCAFGWLTNQLNAQGVECYGVDINEAAIKYGRTQYSHIEGMLICLDMATEPLPFSDGYFDLVIAREFVEHLSDDILFPTIGELIRVTSKHLRVTTPTVIPTEQCSHSEGKYQIWTDYLKTLNDNSLEENLSLVDVHPYLRSEFPRTWDIEHPNTHRREFWIGLFTLLGFELLGFENVCYGEEPYKAMRYDNHCGFGVLDFKRVDKAI